MAHAYAPYGNKGRLMRHNFSVYRASLSSCALLPSAYGGPAGTASGQHKEADPHRRPPGRESMV